MDKTLVDFEKRHFKILFIKMIILIIISGFYIRQLTKQNDFALKKWVVHIFYMGLKTLPKDI